MKQVINIPLGPISEVDEVRQRYDPGFPKVENHITLVYPFEVYSRDDLIRHISRALRGFQSFEITLSGLKKSAKDYYLYLLVDKGKEEVVKLHERLNSGLLKGVKNEDMPMYIPHITLGIFDSEEEIDNAVKEISQKEIYFKLDIREVELLSFEGGKSVSRKKFSL